MLLELEVETLTFGGRGLGRHNGKAVFVPGTAPGDRVRCRVVKDRRQFSEAELCELLVPAEVRRTPPCPVAGSCGGCQWQHLAYAAQLQWKERLFREQLARAGVAPAALADAIVPSAQEFGYRNRVQFKCRQTQSGFVSGFYRPASHFVVDVARCLLVRPAIHDAYAFVRQKFSSAPLPETVPQIDITCSDDDRVTILFHLLPSGHAVMRPWLAALAAAGDFAVALQVGRKETIEVLAGQAGLTMTVDAPPVELAIGAGGFAQVNPEQNRAMVAAVLAAAGLSGTERVLDLYCGVGNFSLPLARRAGWVVGVEEYAPAIADAKANARRNAIDNVGFFSESAEGAIQRHGPFDVVVLDPPRTGACPVMRELLAMRPRRILYVSCDPVTMTRDLQPLVHSGYRVVSARPYDFFPQTWHVESLTVLDCPA